MADDPRTLRELWQRSTPVKRRRLLLLLGTAALAVLVVPGVLIPLTALLA